MIGCGRNSEPLPDTFAVEGLLTDPTGTPVTDGMIMFQSPDNAEHASQGEIQSDGRFRLYTLVDGERIDGARPGDYRATYYPRMSKAQNENPIPIGQSYTVESDENLFEIKLEE